MARPRKRVHWTQTPEGKARLARIKEDRARGSRPKPRRKTPGVSDLKELHLIHNIIESYHMLTDLGQIFVRRSFGD